MMRLLCSVTVSVMAATLMACGGSGSGPTGQATPAPTPRPPVPEVIAQGTGVQICPECGYWLYFSAQTGGTVDITVDYTYPDTSLGLWLAPGHCSFEMSQARQCSWIVTSFVKEKPRRVIQTLSAGEHTLVLDNVTKNPETVSYQVVFTSRAATTAQASPAAQGQLSASPSGPHGPLGSN
jgi:hypothetical protein